MIRCAIGRLVMVMDSDTATDRVTDFQIGGEVIVTKSIAIGTDRIQTAAITNTGMEINTGRVNMNMVDDIIANINVAIFIE